MTNLRILIVYRVYIFKTMVSNPNSITLASFNFVFKKLEHLYYVETNKLSLRK